MKNTEPLVTFLLTEYGKHQMSIGKLSFDYYAFGDSDIDYRTADINAATLKPIIGIPDIKTPIYKKDNNIFYLMTDDKITSDSVIKYGTNEYNIYKKENSFVYLDDKFMSHGGKILNVSNPYIIDVEFDNELDIEEIAAYDFITIYLDDEFKIIEDSLSQILRCQIDNIVVDGKNAKIYLKQPIKSDINDYRFFISSSKFIFLDFTSWNQIFCGDQQLPSYEKRFDGIRQYFDTTTGLLVYHNRPLVSDDFNDTSIQKADMWIPTVIWDKTPVMRMGIHIHTTDEVIQIG